MSPGCGSCRQGASFCDPFSESVAECFRWVRTCTVIRQTVYRWFVFGVGRNGALRIRYGAGCAYNRSGGEVRYGGEIRYGDCPLHILQAKLPGDGAVAPHPATEHALGYGAVVPHPAEEHDRFAETIPVPWLLRHRASDSVIGVGTASGRCQWHRSMRGWSARSLVCLRLQFGKTLCLSYG